MKVPELARTVYRTQKDAVIISESMMPILRKGDKVSVIAGKKPQIGDIILYHSSGRIVCHRYYLSIGKLCFSKGDASKGFDTPWNRNNYIGMVSLDVPISWRIRCFLSVLIHVPSGMIWMLKQILR